MVGRFRSAIAEVMCKTTKIDNCKPILNSKACLAKPKRKMDHLNKVSLLIYFIRVTKDTSPFAGCICISTSSGDKLIDT